MYKVVLTNYGNTQISNKVVLDGVILLADYVANISAITSVAGYSVKLDIPARGNVKDKIGNILIRDDSSNAYIAKTILFYKNVNSEKKIIAGFSQNTAIINKSSKSVNLFLSFDFSSFTNGFQFALVQAGFSQASQNVDGLVHIEDPNVEFDDSYSVYSKVQIDNKLASYAQTSAIPTKTSQLTNDSNYINQHQSIKTINNQSLVGTGNIAISQGEYNKINTISVNSTNQIPDSHKNVNITVPTKVSQLDNDLGFITSGVVPTNYVTVNTAQDITAAKTFKNNTDATKIDGKEIVISGTETYNLSYYDATQQHVNTSINASIISNITNNGISYDESSTFIGYNRNYEVIGLDNSGNPEFIYEKGIKISSNRPYTDTMGEPYVYSYNLLVTTPDDSYGVGPHPTAGGVFITRDDKNGSTSIASFSDTIELSIPTITQSLYIADQRVFVKSGDSPEYDYQLPTLSDYVKQASLFYQENYYTYNSVITAKSNTVIEPSSNNNISLGTSTNKFNTVYATTFNGDLSGNATSATHADSADFADSASYAEIADAAASADYATNATQATQDGNGNTISSYYCTLSTEQTISGKKTFDGNNVDFILKDNERNISFRYSPTYKSWTWITCYNGLNDNYIKLHFTNNKTDVIQLTHTCTSASVNSIQKVKSLLTTPSVDNVWQLGSSNQRLSNIYTTTLYSTDIGDFDNEVDRICTYELFANYVGDIDVPVARVCADALGAPSTPIGTMIISGGHANRCIVIDNSGGEPTIAPDITNYCYLGTNTKHWCRSYINELYIGADNVRLPPIAAVGSNYIGSIQFLRIAIPGNVNFGYYDTGKELSANNYNLYIVRHMIGYDYLKFESSNVASGTWVTLTRMAYANSNPSVQYTYVLAYKKA